MRVGNMNTDDNVGRGEGEQQLVSSQKQAPAAGPPENNLGGGTASVPPPVNTSSSSFSSLANAAAASGNHNEFGCLASSPATTAATTTPEDAEHLESLLARLRGVPWSATAEDVAAFLSPVGVVHTGNILMLPKHEEEYGGDVLVKFDSSNMRNQALRDVHGSHMQNKWIGVFRANQKDVQKFLQGIARESHPVVALRGIPFSSNEYEIVNFFKDGVDLDISVDQVVLGQAANGRLSGDAWVMLGSAAEADAARAQLHMKTIGRRYIEVLPSCETDFDLARKGHFVPVSLRGRAASSSRPSAAAVAAAAAATGSSRGSADCWAEAPPCAAALPYGLSSSSSAPRLSYHPPPSLDGTSDYYARQQQQQQQPPPRLGGGGGPLHHPYQHHHQSPSVGGPPLHHQMPQTTAGGFDVLRTAVLRLRGLPFSANENHIVQFFRGYDMAAILPTTAPIKGRPTGEAYVKFSTPEIATRALRNCDGQRIEKRYIELFPAEEEEMKLAASGVDPRELRSRFPRR